MCYNSSGLWNLISKRAPITLAARKNRMSPIERCSRQKTGLARIPLWSGGSFGQ